MLLLSPLAISQTIHLVGPNGLAQIDDALAIATAGDVIHVEAGTYGQLSVRTGVTIRALVPDSVDILFDPSLMPPNCITDPICWAEHGRTSLACGSCRRAPSRWVVPSGTTLP